jgi:hypothetical protein
MTTTTATNSNMKTGRNDLCPCGSNKKYKRCCGATEVGGEDTASRFFGVAAVLAGVAGVAGVVMVVGSLISGVEDEPKKVWSAEHGHYHTVGGDGSSEGGPGKVWSEEHGHWHDAATPAGAPLEAETPVEGALKGLREAQLEDVARQGGAAPEGER